MKKFILLCAVCALTANSLFAQHSAFHFSVFPPLSTNGKEAKLYTNDFTLGLFVSTSRNERSVALSGLANIIGGSATGVQMAGFYNQMTLQRGVALTGGVNIIKGAAVGAQIAGVYNQVAVGNGAMISDAVNIAKVHTGAVIGGLYNQVGTGNGALISGAVNYSKVYSGAVIGGLFNQVDAGKGALISGLINHNKAYSGPMIAGLYNRTFAARSVQVAGVANIAKALHGVQVSGIVNIADVIHGVQFAGLLNIAKQSDYSIALINIVKNGEKNVAATYNEIGSITASFRSGGAKVFYGIIGGGYNHKASGDAYVVEGGFGAHIDCASWLRINTEAKASYIGSFEDDGTSHFSLGVLPAFRITDYFELFAGPSINFMTSDNVGNSDLFPSDNLWKRHTETRLQQVHLGYVFGMQFLL